LATHAGLCRAVCLFEPAGIRTSAHTETHHHGKHRPHEAPVTSVAPSNQRPLASATGTRRTSVVNHGLDQQLQPGNLAQQVNVYRDEIGGMPSAAGTRRAAAFMGA
jgi:hypothetical protein